MPHTGRVTLRYQLPTIKIDVPVMQPGRPRGGPDDAAHRDYAAGEERGADVETTARKAREAR
jgi:hypothetical protein